jgi:site-specific DNA-adenine methylase
MFGTFIDEAIVANEGAACFISLPQYTVKLYCTPPYIPQNHTAYNSYGKSLRFLGDKLFDNGSPFTNHKTVSTEMQHEVLYRKFGT